MSSKTLRRNILYFYRKNKFPLLFVAGFAISTLLLLKFLKIREISQPPYFYGNINEIVIPPRYNTNQSSIFKYPETLIQLSDKCIERENYRKELLRLVHIPPDDPKTYILHYTVVVGSKTTIGAAIVRKLKKNHEPLVEIEGPYDVNFPDERTNYILGNLTIKEVIIATQPPFPITTEGNPNNYFSEVLRNFYKNILQWSAGMQIPTVCVFTPPYPESHLTTITWYGASIVLVPYIPEITQFDDLNNPYVKIYQDCAYTGHTEIAPNEYPVMAVPSDDIVDQIINIGKDNSRTISIIKGKVQENIKDSMNNYIDSLPERCTIKYTKSFFGTVPEIQESTVIKVGKPDADVTKMLKSAVEKIPRGSTKRSTAKPYLSIVVTGTNDGAGKFAEIVQTYINSIGRSIEKVPEASVEVVIVDFPNPANQTKLRDAINAPDGLTGRVKFVDAPQESYNGKEFPEFLGKNIGIRRAQGDFILITNPDNFLPTHFFEIVARREFNDGVLYRAERYDDNGSIPLESFSKSSENPWLIYEEENFKPICRPYSGFYIIKKKPEYDDYSIGCGAMNFMLTSKDLWHSIGGLNEFPYNANFDTFEHAKFMKLVTGIPEMFLPFKIFHYKHEERVKQNTYDIDGNTGTAQYYCSGESDSTKSYGDSPKWGLPTTHMKITVK